MWEKTVKIAIFNSFKQQNIFKCCKAATPKINVLLLFKFVLRDLLVYHLASHRKFGEISLKVL